LFERTYDTDLILPHKVRIVRERQTNSVYKLAYTLSCI